jgi:hypothetical protein
MKSTMFQLHKGTTKPKCLSSGIISYPRVKLRCLQKSNVFMYMGQLLFTESVIVLKFIITHSEVLSFLTCGWSHKWRDRHASNSSLLGCYAISASKQLLMFQRIVVPSPSGSRGQSIILLQILWYAYPCTSC